jgi:hypothetical protein
MIFFSMVVIWTQRVAFWSCLSYLCFNLLHYLIGKECYIYIYKVDVEMFYSILTKIFQYQLYVYIHNALIIHKVGTFNKNGRTKKPLWRSKSQQHSTR